MASRFRRATVLQDDTVWLLRSVLDLRLLAASPAGSMEARALRAELAARLAAPSLEHAAEAEITALAARLEREAAALAATCAATLRGLEPPR